MAKNGLSHTHPAARSLVKKQCAQRGWTLCVGAGTSLAYERGSPGPFPAWSRLAAELMRSVDPALDEAAAYEMTRRFAPDALIQAAHNRSGMTDAAFGQHLAGTLYADFRAALTPAEWPVVARALRARRPTDCSAQGWADFLEIVGRRYPHLTALGLAEALAPALSTPLAPQAILSFNAEPLLYALLNAVHARSSRTQVLDRVTRSVSMYHAGRVPYCFCHGLLPVPGADGPPRDTAIDKLVFSEGEYLRLANSNFSWQSTTFLSYCSTTSVIFLGISMTDPNMRRWLSWAHENRRRELADAAREPDARFDSTIHYWVNVAPAAAEERRWTEYAVEHLGIRMVWIDAWRDAVPFFRALLGGDAAAPAQSPSSSSPPPPSQTTT